MVSKNVTETALPVKKDREEVMAKKNSENGFSLIELLLVCVIIGILAALAVPAYQKATSAADNASMRQMLRILHTTEATYYTQKGRFGRLDEIYPELGNQGTLVVNKIVRGKHTYEMLPVSDAQLKTGFTITATGNISNGLLETREMTESGEMVIFP